MSASPFRAKRKKANHWETAQRGLLFLSTYAIVFFAMFIFGKIIFSGAPILMDKGWEFFTRKPETLEVASFDKGQGFLAPDEVLETMHRYNDNLPITDEESVEVPSQHKSFCIDPGSIIGDGYLAIIEQANPGFRPGFASRDTTSEIGFPVSTTQNIRLTPESFAQLKASSSSLSVDKATEVNEVTNSFPVVFPKGFYNIPVKTVKSLQASELIYILYGNLTDKGDDELESLMPLDIPETQTITLTEQQYAALENDSGDFKLAKTEAVKTTIKKWQLPVEAGEHHASFEIFSMVLAENPSLPVKHQHNIERGSVVLDIDDATATLTVPAAAYAAITTSNPGLKLSNIEDVTIPQSFTKFSLTKACEIQLPTTEMQAFKLANSKTGAIKILKEYTHSYSAGGVSGPLLGTALLVFFCMIIALAIGVASSVYINEYASKGRGMNTIRLAMMNLAGVPSIVFGLFGLGLFVVLAPKMTSTPSLHDKFRIPITPAFSEPDLRAQEREKIVVVEESADQDSAKALASRQGYARYYDGWTYLSFEGWGSSIIAGAFTLAIMVLPVIITSCEESLKAVPMGFREASLALGASKWQSIRTAVLPYAMPGILTASVLGITRVAGETAPIMFTAAVAEKSSLPFQGLQSTGFDKFTEFLSQNVQALPYHIYTVSGRIPQSEYTEPMQYGSVLVFMMIVMLFAGLSVWMRARMRKKYKW